MKNLSIDDASDLICLMGGGQSGDFNSGGGLSVNALRVPGLKNLLLISPGLASAKQMMHRIPLPKFSRKGKLLNGILPFLRFKFLLSERGSFFPQGGMIRELVAALPSGAGKNFLVSFGTPGPEQKIHVVGYDERFIPSIHVKIANGSAANLMIENEVTSIRAVGLSVPVPKLLSTGCFCGRNYAAFEFLEDFGHPDFTDVMGVLESLVSAEKYSVFDSFIWRRIEEGIPCLPDSFGFGMPLLLATIKKLREVLAQIAVRQTWTHGDFAPWNVRKSDSGVVLIDWEHSGKNGLPLIDAIHWKFQVASLIEKSSVDALLNSLLDFEAGADLYRIAQHSGIKSEWLPWFLKIYILHRIGHTSFVNRVNSFDPEGQTTNIAFCLKVLEALKES